MLIATPLSVVCIDKLIGVRVATTDLAGLSSVVHEDVEMLQVIVVELSCLVDMADLSLVAGDTVDMLSLQLLLVTLLPLTDEELPSVVKEHVHTLHPFFFWWIQHGCLEKFFSAWLLRQRWWSCLLLQMINVICL